MGSIAEPTSTPALPPLQPSPEPNIVNVGDGIKLLEPLSRQGTGPGLILLAAELEDNSADNDLAINEGVPSALLKWAEESYTVVQISRAALNNNKNALQNAGDALSLNKKCEPKGSIGLIAYDSSAWNTASPALSSIPSLAGCIVYGTASSTHPIAQSPIPTLIHLAGPIPASQKPTRSPALTIHHYSGSISHLFATPFSTAFHYANESVSHTRNLTFLKRLMGGPTFDLEAIWDEHTYYEFENRSVEHTMSTMVAEPYVNHIPTLTGGIGRKNLTAFYTHNFVFSNPPDTSLELISRTIGIDRIVDEFIFKFTHTSEVPWLVPGIPPTGKFIEVPFTAIVNIRGDRLYHEHIAWDQASVLKQLELLPEWVPWPHADPGVKGSTAAEPRANGGANGDGVNGASQWEVRLPVFGNETSAKIRDKDGVASNGLIERAEKGEALRRVG